MSTITARMGQRRGSISQWTNANPVLKRGEIALVTVGEAQSGPGGTTWYRLKVGDGVTAWASLPWASMGEGTAISQAMANLIAQEVQDRDAAIAASMVGMWNDRGGHDPASGQYPTTGGSGSGGAIRKGDTWTVEADGVIQGVPVDKGDTLRVLVTTPGQDNAKWAISEANVQQATTVMRGTLKVALQAAIEDPATTNDTDAVTPRKWWQGWAKGLTLTEWANAVRATVLTGLSTATDAVVEATDSILVGMGKLQAQLTAFRRKVVVNSQTGTAYTLVLADGGQDRYLRQSNASPITTTIPANASVAFPVGTMVMGIQAGDGQVTIAPASGVTLLSLYSARKTAGKGAGWTAIKVATDTWDLQGALVP